MAKDIIEEVFWLEGPLGTVWFSASNFVSLELRPTGEVILVTAKGEHRLKFATREIAEHKCKVLVKQLNDFRRAVNNFVIYKG